MTQETPAPRKKPIAAHAWVREPNEHYVEEKWCSARLFEEEEFIGGILDPCCGFGRIVESARAHGLQAVGTDIERRAPGFRSGLDFLSDDYPHELLLAPELGGQCASIVCNPPFAVVEKFALKALAVAPSKVAMIFPVARLNAAHWLRGTPLARVLLMTPRPSMPPGHVITAGERPGGGKMDYAWLIFDQKYAGTPELKWLRRDKPSPVAPGISVAA